jgi:UDP-N-acetylmuramoylalanine--D-glutamate ligase
VTTGAPQRVVVVGLGVTGDAVLRWAAAAGHRAVVVDDRPGSVAPERRAVADALGVAVTAVPTGAEAAALLAGADLVVPSPGVPAHHPFLRAAATAGVPRRSEVDLAAEILAARGRTLVAITGTNGKTTVTELTVAVCRAGGVAASAAGNIGAPLLDEAVGGTDPVVVAEVSSFQLAGTTAAFRPGVAGFLNLAADHLDWHGTFTAYGEAKARIFAHQGPGDVLVASADDPEVAALAATTPGRLVTFSVAPTADTGYRVGPGADGAVLLTDDDREIVPVAALRDPAPHDLANALAASALAAAAGVDPVQGGAALRDFVKGDHRMRVVAEIDGVPMIDDSKATNVHAALAAIRSFPRVVLIAGGRNKGLDLTALRSGADRLAAVVAIGDASAEIAAAFRGVVPVSEAESMEAAVRAAVDHAAVGVVVLLSPACASFDWYGSYAERGRDFARAVLALVEARS